MACWCLRGLTGGALPGRELTEGWAAVGCPVPRTTARRMKKEGCSIHLDLLSPLVFCCSASPVVFFVVDNACTDIDAAAAVVIAAVVAAVEVVVVVAVVVVVLVAVVLVVVVVVVVVAVAVAVAGSVPLTS